MEKIMEQMHVYIIQYGVSIIAAVLIFVIGKWIARFLSNTAERLIMKTNGEKTLASFGRNIVYVVLLVFVIIAAIGKLGRTDNLFYRSNRRRRPGRRPCFAGFSLKFRRRCFNHCFQTVQSR